MWGQIDCKGCFELEAHCTSHILAAYLVRYIKCHNTTCYHSKTRGVEFINVYIYIYIYIRCPLKSREHILQLIGPNRSGHTPSKACKSWQCLHPPLSFPDQTISLYSKNPQTICVRLNSKPSPMTYHKFFIFCTRMVGQLPLQLLIFLQLLNLPIRVLRSKCLCNHVETLWDGW